MRLARDRIKKSVTEVQSSDSEVDSKRNEDMETSDESYSEEEATGNDQRSGEESNSPNVYQLVRNRRLSGKKPT